MSPTRKQEGRRAEVETELNEKYHVDFVFREDVPTSEFDIDKSLANQARFQALDEETVELYREAIERGDKFPALVAIRSGRATSAKLITVDGNHRLVAHDRAGKPVDVYEIDRATRGPAVALMTYAFNAKHGRPTSEDERVVQAMYLIDNGSSQAAAAAEVNVPLRLVQRAVSRAQADRRAIETGIDIRQWEALTAEARRRLLNVSTDEGFVGAVGLAQKARLAQEELITLITLLNTNRSGTKQKAIIKAESERLQERIQDSTVLGNTTRRVTTPKARVGMILGQVLALPDDFGALARGYTEGERAEAAGRILDASERLRKLAKTVDPAIK